jgi:hypothetical protein
MKDMVVARVAQESPPLDTSTEVFGNKGHLAHLGDQAADIEAPVGVEVIDHPVVTIHLWQLFKVDFLNCPSLLLVRIATYCNS